jgi:hypothetical protein
VYLLHQTARKFLLRTTKGVSPPARHVSENGEDGVGSSFRRFVADRGWRNSIAIEDAHDLLAPICVQYARQYTEDSAPQPTFFHYAALHWPDHFGRFRDACQRRWSSIAKDLCSPSMARWSSISYKLFSRSIRVGRHMPDSALGISSALGLASVVEMILSQDLPPVQSSHPANLQSSNQGALPGALGATLARTLGRVAATSTMPVAEMAYMDHSFALANRVAYLVERENYIQRALNYAARNGHESVLWVLYNSGFDINKVIRKVPTPLGNAAASGHERIVQLDQQGCRP